MWRAFFLGIGIYLIIAGAECLAVDRVFWRIGGTRADGDPLSEAGCPEAEGIPPRPVGPWSLLIHGGRGLPVLLHHPGADGRQSERVSSRHTHGRTILRTRLIYEIVTGSITQLLHGVAKNRCFSGK